MSIKVLVIDDDPAFRALFRHHITTEWPDAAITEHDPLTTGKLAAEFTAAGYDVVLLDHMLGVESGHGGDVSAGREPPRFSGAVADKQPLITSEPNTRR